MRHSPRGRALAAPAPDDGFVAAGAIAEGTGVLNVDLAADGDPAALVPHFARTAIIRIPFRSFADGRGFTLARRLRQLGFRGRIRASGHLIPDQWPLVRACGIDEVEIDAAQAARQPEAAWRAARGRPGYLGLLR
jgi:uncharacterized protein (DUF934 family)